MSATANYHGMEYSEDHAKIAEWVPLIMEGRDPRQPVAATRMQTGTDVNFGELTRQLRLIEERMARIAREQAEAQRRDQQAGTTYLRDKYTPPQD